MVQARPIPAHRQAASIVTYLQVHAPIGQPQAQCRLTRPAVAHDIGQRLVRELVQSEGFVLGQRCRLLVKLGAERASPCLRGRREILNVGA